MRPRTAYRLTCVLAPLAILAAVVAVIGGAWLLALVMGLAATSASVTRRDLRRRGVDWNGPASFRAFRALGAERAGADAGSGRSGSRRR